jgi:hypothetical protein
MINGLLQQQWTQMMHWFQVASSDKLLKATGSVQVTMSANLPMNILWYVAYYTRLPHKKTSHRFDKKKGTQFEVKLSPR